MGNGGVIGPRNLASKSRASGVWSLGTVWDARLKDIWPLALGLLKGFHPGFGAAGIAVTEGDMRVSLPPTTSGSIRSRMNRPGGTGAFYVEFEVLAAPTTNSVMLGLCTPSFSMTALPGSSGASTWSNSGSYNSNGSGTGTVDTFTVGDRVGVAYDPSSTRMFFFKNGVRTSQLNIAPPTQSAGLHYLAGRYNSASAGSGDVRAAETPLHMPYGCHYWDDANPRALIGFDPAWKAAGVTHTEYDQGMSSNSGVSNTRSRRTHNSGHQYIEFLVQALSDGTNWGIGIGLAPPEFANNTQLGGANSYTLQSYNNTISLNNAFQAQTSGVSWAVGDRVGLSADFVNRKLYWYRNGVRGTRVDDMPAGWTNLHFLSGHMTTNTVSGQCRIQRTPQHLPAGCTYWEA